MIQVDTGEAQGEASIVLGEQGRLALVEATPDGYREKASAQVLEGRSWTMPTLAGGRLFLRNHTEMVSLDQLRTPPPIPAALDELRRRVQTPPRQDVLAERQVQKRPFEVGVDEVEQHVPSRDDPGHFALDDSRDNRFHRSAGPSNASARWFKISRPKIRRPLS